MARSTQHAVMLMGTQLSEPKHAYVASPYTLEELESSGGYGGEYNTMHLDPSEAVSVLFRSLWETPDDDFVANIYQVELSKLRGVWPRVSDTFNDTQLKWTCLYNGKIPCEALRWISATKADSYVPRETNRFPWSW